jgi:hypothetical protein
MLSPVDYQNSLGNTSIRLSKLWQIMLNNVLEKDVGLPLMKWAKVVLLR